MKNHFRLGLAVLLFGVTACEPVFAIGWREIFIVFFLMAILFGPPVYRFIRKCEEFLKSQRKDK